MTKKNYFLFILFTLLCVTSIVNAQIYEVANYKQDKTKVSRDSDDYKELADEKCITLNNGDEIKVVGLDKKYYRKAFFVKDGIRYTINAGYLIFSEKNATGVKDRFEGLNFCPNTSLKEAPFNNWSPHSEFGKFLCSNTIPMTIMSLVIISYLLLMASAKLHFVVIRVLALYLAPILLTAIVAIEIYYALYMGDFLVWWADPDMVGFFTAIYKSFFALIIVVFQFGIFFSYKSLIAEGEELSVKPIFLSLLLLLPVTIIVLIIITLISKAGHIPREDVSDIMKWLIIGMMSIFMGYSILRNIKKIGFIRGLLFTIFTIIYSLGCVIALMAVGYLLVKIIFIILAQLFFIGVIAWFLLSKTGSNVMDSGGQWVSNPNYSPGNGESKMVYGEYVKKG